MSKAKERVLLLTQEQKQWSDQCPIRVFRRKHNLTVADLARLIGAAAGAVHYWEKKGAVPRTILLEGLARVMGSKPKTLERSILKWISKKP